MKTFLIVIAIVLMVLCIDSSPIQESRNFDQYVPSVVKDSSEEYGCGDKVTVYANGKHTTDYDSPEVYYKRNCRGKFTIL